MWGSLSTFSCLFHNYRARLFCVDTLQYSKCFYDVYCFVNILLLTASVYLLWCSYMNQIELVLTLRLCSKLIILVKQKATFCIWYHFICEISGTKFENIHVPIFFYDLCGVWVCDRGCPSNIINDYTPLKLFTHVLPHLVAYQRESDYLVLTQGAREITYCISGFPFTKFY